MSLSSPKPIAASIPDLAVDEFFYCLMCIIPCSHPSFSDPLSFRHRGAPLSSLFFSAACHCRAVAPVILRPPHPFHRDPHATTNLVLLFFLLGPLYFVIAVASCAFFSSFAAVSLSFSPCRYCPSLCRAANIFFCPRWQPPRRHPPSPQCARVSYLAPLFCMCSFYLCHVGPTCQPPLSVSPVSFVNFSFSLYH